MEQPGLKHRHHLLSSNALPGQTLDQCLQELVAKRIITREIAREKAKSPELF